MSFVEETEAEHQRWRYGHWLTKWLHFWGDLGATHFFHEQKSTVWIRDREASIANGVNRYVSVDGTERMEFA